MLNNKKYVVLSLELHLFFARIMKEHSFFLEASFMPKDSNYAKRAAHYKGEFEKLLQYAVKAGNHVIRPQVADSGEIVTEYTLKAEEKSQFYTDIKLNQDITKTELNLKGSNNPKISNNLIDYVNQINTNAIKVLNGLIRLKEDILSNVLSCKLFTLNYPLLIEHILREAKLYLSLVDDLEKGIDIDSRTVKEIELFWDQIMMEHSLFIRGLLDPSEKELVKTANDFACDFENLLNIAQSYNMKNESLINKTIDNIDKLNDFQIAGVKGLNDCEIKSIMLPLLADHTIRESNHFIRLLKSHID